MRLLACLLVALPLGFQALYGQPERLTSQDLEAFLDGLIPAAIERGGIAGAVVAVVKDGQVVLKKGYGYADVGAKKPVSADATLFRPGSISKLFVWTSVMQLVEQGKLDLDRDLNNYLDFRVPPGITMRHIMTHSSGFEETVRELFVPSAKEMDTLRGYLTGHLPRQIFTPGTVPAYSNYATSLAGYIVERLSGEPFVDYASAHVLKPLGMEHTTFAQPLPDALKPMMSLGYEVAALPAKDFEFVKAYPAGSVSTTAADMTRFMMAHLNGGASGEVRILKPETVEQMHTRQASPYPAMHAMALGFYEESRNGHHIIGHGGDTAWFHSNLSLILDANTGLYISQNSAGKETDLRGLVFRKFMDRYFPYALPKAEALATAKQNAAEVAGHYVSSRRVEGGLPAVLNGLSQLSVTVNADGTINGPFKLPSGEVRKLTEIAPFVFRAEETEDRVAFRKDQSGRWEMNIGYPFMVFQKATFFDHMYSAYGSYGFGFGMVLLMLLGWPIAAAVRWHYGRRLTLSASEMRLRRAVQVCCALQALFIAAILWVGTSMNASISAIGPALDGKQHFAQAIGWLAALGVPVGLYAMVQTWTAAGAWWFTKVRDTAVALALIACTWFAWHWQLLNFSTQY